MLDLVIFIPTCFALNMAFGPNNLIALTHGAEKGFVFALYASLARILVFIPMILISALGLGAILATSAFVFSVVKIAGAIYLIWLGCKLVYASYKSQTHDYIPKPANLFTAFKREGLIAAGNPKAILIFAAFFPQFVDTTAYTYSYVVLGSIFLLLELLAISVYALIGYFAVQFASSKIHWFLRSSGVGMAIFGILLLFTRGPTENTS